jgi:hypothetical protein
MTTDRTPLRRPRLWLATGGILALLGIAILWPLQQVGQVCILIYPAPPGCGAQEPRWVPLVGIGLVIAAFAAIVVVYFTVPRPRTVIIILAGAIVVIVALAAAIVGLSQLGIWDPYQPPVIVN